MNILIAGASGLIGSALVKSFSPDNFTVYSLRRNSSVDEFGWNPEKGVINLDGIESLDVVINLAGENIADGRWTKQKKERILQSRVAGNSFLIQELLQRNLEPRLYISGSAIGYYGDCGSVKVNEEAPVGDSFLADVCRQWERSSNAMVEAGVRTVFLRLGMVLASQGGALKKMLLPFKLGVGGPIANGSQFVSWIALQDVCRAIHFCIDNESIDGAVNLASPNSLTNKEFSKVLGSALRRPAFMPLPALIARIILGDMADELMLSSVRAMPEKLLNAGFRFKYTELEVAFGDIFFDD